VERLSSVASFGTKRVDALTSIRFLLALQVVVRHTLSTFVPGVNERAAGSTLYGFLWRQIVTPSFSVSFFFLLSGYVLALVYLREGREVEKRRFLAARIARIFPLYVVTLVWDGFFLLSERLAHDGWVTALGKTAVTFGADLAMLQAWCATRLAGIDDPNWSISAEFFFYLCFPVLGVALWRLRGASVWIAMACIYVGGQALVWVVRPHLPIVIALCLPLLHLSTFALGILLARWQALRAEKTKAQAWQANLVLAVSAIALVLLIQLPFRLLAFDYSFMGLLAPIMMGIIWALSSAPTLFSRLLSTGWLVALGESSYAAGDGSAAVSGLSDLVCGIKRFELLLF
jgi:peptidoglycan/LPS O-acetylase OafA/YrhL